MADRDPLAPVTTDGSPGFAYATHRQRADEIARHFALTRKLSQVQAQQAGEDNVTTLIAHYHMVSVNPEFSVEGEGLSRELAPQALLRLNPGNGLVGTKGASTERDYDMALKGLVVLLYRYAPQLGVTERTHIIDQLFPDYLVGGHPPEIEIVEFSFLEIDAPETENHLLMIESSRYLINQWRARSSVDPTFDNRANGLTDWLLRTMQTFLRHDFLEFNSRPYQRLALHPLLNLYEFADDRVIRTAAQMVLDYTLMKFAVSSNRGRRVSPFRRVQHRINHVSNERNDLFAPSGEQVAGFFLAATGWIDPAGNPARFPQGQDFTGLLGALSSYRPPPAAYIVAMRRDNPPALHRFFHGRRPMLPAGEEAEPGLEIYYRSPSYLISAGGSFLNSGYSRDEIDLFKEAWEQTSRAQATTVIPTRADTQFHDLVRFGAYPDPPVDPYHDDREDPDTLHAQSVNYGVVADFAAGANLRPAEHITVLEETTGAGPSLTTHRGALYAAWKGDGNDNVNVGLVLATTVMLDGVEGIGRKVTLPESCDSTPVIASHNDRLYVAWKGSGNEQLNIAVSFDDGHTFEGKTVLSDESDHAPALTSHGGRLHIAWTGLDDQLNIAKLIQLGSTAGTVGFEVEQKATLGDTSDGAPAIWSHNGRLFLAWRGSGNDNLNLAFSADGVAFGGKASFPDSSSHGPSLTTHRGRLFMGWRGAGNDNLNIAQVSLIGNTAGALVIEGLTAKVVLGDTSDDAPAISSWNDVLVVASRGQADDTIDLRISRDATFAPVGPWIFADRADLGFYLAAYRTPPARPDQLVEPLDTLGFVHIVEKAAMDARGLTFDGFRDAVLQSNPDLPARLEYGGHYRFHTPDDRTISMWFESVGAKYTPRVVDQSDPVDDFTRLPLVQGPFMQARGHEGYVEIRTPGCDDAPLILDHRNATNPVRTDNVTTCAWQWYERTAALFATALQLDGDGKRIAARAPRLEAAGLYGELVRGATQLTGSLLAPAVVTALASVGIDFSVPVGELNDWLANPDFTPYPTLAQALLSLGRTLARPVFIDVIAFNYESTPGVASPRHVDDVRQDVLQAAIVQGWNVRYGEQLAVTDFDRMFSS